MKKVYLILIILTSFFLTVSAAQAATLYFSPSSGSYKVGDSFSVNVFVSSASQSINAVSGTISFPADKLAVSSLSKGGSIINLWVSEPSFSASAGTINFEGVVLNPGFAGAAGKIITINLKVKAAGSAGLSFTAGSVLANDGQGTNILASMGRASFELGGSQTSGSQNKGEGTAQPAPEETRQGQAPAAPQVSSPSHPEEAKWYSNNNPVFQWRLTNDITGVNVLADHEPATNPGTRSDGLFSSYEYKDVEDGIWYFHIKLKNAKGWGAVSHFRFQIDTKPPEPFSIKIVDGKETDNPRPTIIFDTTDNLSGIAHYKVKVGEGDFFSTNPEIVKSNPHTLSHQAPGKHTILVQAFDKADNYTTATEELIIKPIVAPAFTDCPAELKSNAVLIIKGTAQPDSEITVWLQRERDEAVAQNVSSDEKGDFTFIAKEKLEEGIYQVWAKAIDKRGAESEFSKKITTVVTKPAILRISSEALNLLSVLTPLIAVIIIFIFFLWYSWHKFLLFKKKLRHEIHGVGKYFHKSFSYLKEDTQRHIKMLERTKSRRELTKEEDKILKRLKNNLDSIERTISEEIEEIENKIK